MNRVARVVWGLLLLFGAFVIRESLELSYYGTDFGPGPGVFSFWLGVLVVGLSVIEIAGTFRRPAAPLPEGFIPDRNGVTRMLCVVGALVATLLLMGRLGFSLTMLGFCLFLLRRLGRQPWWLTLALSLVASFGLFHLFRLLQVFLPKGVLGI